MVKEQTPGHEIASRLSMRRYMLLLQGIVWPITLYALSAHYWDKSVEGMSSVCLQMRTFVGSQMDMTFTRAREGVGYLGFGRCVGTVSRPWKTKQTMVSRRVCSFLLPHFQC